jgi:hypothetical protein
MNNMKKGKRMNNKNIRYSIDKKNREIPDSFRSKRIDSQNMVNGADTPPQSYVTENMETDSTKLESDNDEVETENNQASTSIRSTLAIAQKIRGLKLENKRLSDELADLKAKKYTAGGAKEEDLQKRVEKHTEFENKTDQVSNSPSLSNPEIEEITIRRAMFRILRGIDYTQFESIDDEDLFIKQLLEAKDNAHVYTTNFPMLIKNALGMIIYDDRCKDATSLARSYIYWSNIEELTEHWTVKKFIFELMKCQVVGFETNRFVSKLPECSVRKFFDELYDFDRCRNQNIFNVNPVSSVVDSTKSFEAHAFHNGSSKRFNKVWKNLLLVRNIENSEANKKIAKERFETRRCLYCGKVGHSYFGCKATKGKSGYFWR